MTWPGTHTHTHTEVSINDHVSSSPLKCTETRVSVFYICLWFFKLLESLERVLQFTTGMNEVQQNSRGTDGAHETQTLCTH